MRVEAACAYLDDLHAHATCLHAYARTVEIVIDWGSAEANGSMAVSDGRAVPAWTRPIIFDIYKLMAQTTHFSFMLFETDDASNNQKVEAQLIQYLYGECNF